MGYNTEKQKAKCHLQRFKNMRKGRASVYVILCGMILDFKRWEYQREILFHRSKMQIHFIAGAASKQ
jgi:hypothetical protein